LPCHAIDNSTHPIGLIISATMQLSDELIKACRFLASEVCRGYVLVLHRVVRIPYEPALLLGFRLQFPINSWHSSIAVVSKCKAVFPSIRNTHRGHKTGGGCRSRTSAPQSQVKHPGDAMEFNFHILAPIEDIVEQNNRNSGISRCPSPLETHWRGMLAQPRGTRVELTQG
jgi:hypothetical protein